MSILDQSRGRGGKERHAGINAVEARNAVFEAEEMLLQRLAELRDAMPVASLEATVVANQITGIRRAIEAQRNERAAAFRHAASTRS